MAVLRGRAATRSCRVQGAGLTTEQKDFSMALRDAIKVVKGGKPVLVDVVVQMWLGAWDPKVEWFLARPWPSMARGLSSAYQGEAS
jgi:hypothetical protein